MVGMAVRLPGADRLDQFWSNLLAGRDCVTRTPVEQLRGLVDDALLDDPRWVGASGRISRPFDADPSFFGMSAKEALLTDPQHRLLLATVHQALEDACHVPQRGSGTTGIYGGLGSNQHAAIVRAVLANRDEPADELAIEVGNDKDHGIAKVAYRLGLHGPAIAIQTACSTGLVALHQAGQALMGYECDAAVVAAAAIRVPDRYGYLHLAGGIGSPDGTCRAFSAAAAGTVSSDGVVAVVLKRYEDAVAAGDRIYAVVRGSAVNNDGSKSGYAMFSAAAQERVIRDALLFSELDPKMIGAVEAHGSGTPLGDAVEWSALSAVYGPAGNAKVGSVKSAIGHTREASGLAGFVRMALSIYHGQIPATLHVDTPAENVMRAGGLSLAMTTADWCPPDRRTGAVSSFGLGGTNVHVLLEQAPDVGAAEPRLASELVLISAHTETAADRTAAAWHDAVRTGALSLDEAADVSQFGRRHGRVRQFAVAKDAAELANELDRCPAVSTTSPSLCFAFPGIDDQYPGMAAGLAGQLPGFAERLREYMDICSEQAGRDLSDYLRPASTGPIDPRLRRRPTATARVDESTDLVASEAMSLSVQLALAASLTGLGVRALAVVGQGLGELAAATYANVMRSSDALRLAVERARLVAAQPEGAMLTVALSRAEAEELTGPDIHLAVVNSPRSCVLAGAYTDIEKLAKRLEQRGRPGSLLPTRSALHTPLLAEAGAELAELLVGVPLSPPDVAMASNLTGVWATEAVAEPSYWQRQLTSPVLFSDALRSAADCCDALVEIGAGRLRTLAAQSQTRLGDKVIATVRREYQNETDVDVLLRALGRLWQMGVEPDWQALRPDVRPLRTSAPPTATEDQPFWIAEGAVLPGLTSLPAPPHGTSTSEATRAPSAPATRSVGPDELEAVLARLWQEILGDAAPTSTDDFFELGGDSMMSVRLLAGVKEAVGLVVPAPVIFEDSSLGGMARRITEWRDRIS
ncbi:type I polyketide synthase [Catellatospora methionotrophica]|uniref:type I polyketide synthase n=1 Tax=Catellatospora methionotrophica TaxID=121620 RepID=UPI00340C23AE